MSPIKVSRLALLSIAAVFALSAPAAAPSGPAANTAPAPAPAKPLRVVLATPAQWNLAGQTDLSDEGKNLLPGDYRQLAEFQASAPVAVLVDIPSQLAGVYQQNQLVAITTVSTGKPGHETPTGTFRVIGKEVDHHSNLYNNAPMPYMQRLTNDGVSIHAGKITGVPSSHGCVRMPLGMAKLLYSATKVGTEVTVIDGPAPPSDIETAGLSQGKSASSPAG